MDTRILSIRDNPEYLDRAVDYLSSKWGIPKNIYHDSITHSITTTSPLPRWYLMLKGEEIIGCYGLITNDFNSRQDLWPWLAALYIDPNERGKNLGAELLKHGAKEANKLGFAALHLFTDHVGYYEKYGWEYTCNAYGVDGEASRVYAIKTDMPL